MLSSTAKDMEIEVQISWQQISQDPALWKELIYTPAETESYTTIISTLRQMPGLQNIDLSQGPHLTNAIVETICECCPNIRKLLLHTNFGYSKDLLCRLILELYDLESFQREGGKNGVEKGSETALGGDRRWLWQLLGVCRTVWSLVLEPSRAKFISHLACGRGFLHDWTVGPYHHSVSGTESWGVDVGGVWALVFTFGEDEGKYTNHKGKNRRFTNPEEIEEQMRREEKERKWREERGDASSSEEEASGTTKAKKTHSSSESESSEEESEDEV
uniref:Uncharacterized protein n=1 Tax=Timema bartmani TaxID=61472 RepID=A0A7R9I5P7_9NEOP|nr:unnamed protein product [Timema bartmani]